MAKTQTIQPGYCAAIHLMPQTAPEACYIGMVEAVDDHGVLINLVHWDHKLDMIGGYFESIFVPWGNINSMLISTEKQPTRRFMADRAPKWKQEIEVQYQETPVRKKKQAA